MTHIESTSREPTEIAIGIAIGTADAAVSSDRNIAKGKYEYAPPAALLPVIHGEAIEASNGKGVDQLGTALPWPSVGRVDDDIRAGRFPAAYAWRLLEQTESEWTWKFNEVVRSTTSAEAIAAIAHASLPQDSSRRNRVALVVPNSLDLSSQDELLGRLRAQRMREPMLLWRPIAGALAWLEEYAKNFQVDAMPFGESLGDLAFVHLGTEVFEADILELIPYSWRDRVWILPARSQPGIPSLYDLPLSMAEYLVGETLGQGDDWYRLWASDWLRNELGRGLPLFTGADESNDRAREIHRHRWYTLFDRPCPDSVLRNWRRKWGVGTHPHRRPELDGDTAATFEHWLEIIASATSSSTLRGIVVTGEFSSDRSRSSPAGRLIAQICEGHDRVHVLTEQPNDAVGGPLAQGAALFMYRHLRGQPTYFDTLPMLETLAIRKGEPSWQSLIEQEERYVLGGKKLTFVPADLDFRIKSEERTLTLSVYQEGFESVREIKEPIHTRLERDVSVRLKIQIAAGQGNPRVEVLPVEHRDLRGQRVYLDWNRATDTQKNKEQIAEEVPRTNPPLDPRQSSSNCWQGYYRDTMIVPLMEHALDLLDRPGSRNLPIAIRDLYQRLWSRDEDMRHRHPPVHATAFDSDGRFPNRAAQYELVKAFRTKAVEVIAARPSDKLRQDLIRTLGYMSSSSGAFLRFLRTRLADLESAAARDRNALLIAFGNCLRTSEDIALYARKMANEFATESPRAPLNWMRALCQMLRYREDAAENIPSGVCGRLAWHCYLVAREQVVEERAAKYLYRFGTLSVAFLLRRRRYDDGYMNPNHVRSREIKKFLSATIERMRRRRIAVLRGVVDPVYVTGMIIDYIDRKGRGLLIVDE
jgi:hypothetical protein